MASRGNDIYWGTVRFLLQQSAIFKSDFNFYLRPNDNQPAWESLFLDASKTDIEYVMCVDSDVEPHPETPMRLIGRIKAYDNIDIITAPVWMYHPGSADIHLNIHFEEDLNDRVRVPRSGDVEEIVSTSFSACLFRRELLDSFITRGEAFIRPSELVPRLYRGHPSDVVFFQKARAMGHKIWVDWDCEPGAHHKYVRLDNKCLRSFHWKSNSEIKQVEAVCGA